VPSPPAIAAPPVVAMNEYMTCVTRPYVAGVASHCFPCEHLDVDLPETVWRLLLQQLEQSLDAHRLFPAPSFVN
jgi:hypothetical protein